jgi:hypothetical protein
MAGFAPQPSRQISSCPTPSVTANSLCPSIDRRHPVLVENVVVAPSIHFVSSSLRPFCAESRPPFRLQACKTVLPEPSAGDNRRPPFLCRSLLSAHPSVHPALRVAARSILFVPHNSTIKDRLDNNSLAGDTQSLV